MLAAKVERNIEQHANIKDVTVFYREIQLAQEKSTEAVIKQGVP